MKNEITQAVSLHNMFNMSNLDCFVFAGPTAIKRAIAYSFDDKIIVSNVTLTPSLQIQFGRLILILKMK